MEYIYPHISCGYTGYGHSNQLTINASFYKEIFKDITCLEGAMVFPQRVPKIGYFAELSKLEIPPFSQHFALRTQYIISQTTLSLKNLAKDQAYLSQALNYLQLMLRFGLFDAILTCPVPNNAEQQIIMEIKFIIESAKIETQLSANTAVILDNIAILAEHAYHDSKLNHKTKLRLLNRLLVYHYRHRAKTDPALIAKCRDWLIQEL